MIYAGVVVAAAVVGASAQSLTSLSASCQAAAAAVLTGPASECLGVSGLVNIAMTPANQSIVTPINNWLTSTCPQPACTNATLDAAFANLTTGCASDLSAVGYTSDDITEITTTFKEWYPTGREVACLQDTNANNAFCVTTTLQSIENYLGVPMSQNFTTTVVSKFATTEPPKNLTCTDCIHAAYTIIRPKLDSESQTSIDNYLNTQCGSTFVDGSTPSTIKQSANAAASGSSNGAMALSSGILGSAASLLAGVAGVAVLAL